MTNKIQKNNVFLCCKSVKSEFIEQYESWYWDSALEMLEQNSCNIPGTLRGVRREHTSRILLKMLQSLVNDNKNDLQSIPQKLPSEILQERIEYLDYIIQCLEPQHWLLQDIIKRKQVLDRGAIKRGGAILKHQLKYPPTKKR